MRESGGRKGREEGGGVNLSKRNEVQGGGRTEEGEGGRDGERGWRT